MGTNLWGYLWEVSIQRGGISKSLMNIKKNVYLNMQDWEETVGREGDEIWVVFSIRTNLGLGNTKVFE